MEITSFDTDSLIFRVDTKVYFSIHPGQYAASGINAKVTLTISKGTATIKLNSECKQATKMQATITLQKQVGLKWVDVKSMKKSASASKLNVTCKTSVPVSGINKIPYRAKETVQANKGKKTQIVTVYSKTVKSY